MAFSFKNRKLTEFWDTWKNQRIQLNYDSKIARKSKIENFP